MLKKFFLSKYEHAAHYVKSKAHVLMYFNLLFILINIITYPVFLLTGASKETTMAFVAPAALVVALKAVYNLAAKKG